ncbi:MAG: hypothetical protein U0Q16_16555 [Bryobacteraceae bacterium]
MGAFDHGERRVVAGGPEVDAGVVHVDLELGEFAEEDGRQRDAFDDAVGPVDRGGVEIVEQELARYALEGGVAGDVLARGDLDAVEGPDGETVSRNMS